MDAILLLFVATFGAVMLFDPKLFYDFSQGWKNGSESGPSDLYILSTRISGALFLLAGTACLIFLLLS